jgi:hypothetical protein
MLWLFMDSPGYLRFFATANAHRLRSIFGYLDGFCDCKVCKRSAVSMIIDDPGWGFVVGKTASCAAMALTFANYAVAGPGGLSG